MRALFAAVALLSSGALPAATIGGRLNFPSEALPGMIVVARNAAGATIQAETKPGQERYRLQVPAGGYVVFAIPIGVATTPGQIPLRGAHTAYSVCGRDKAKQQAGQCQTGPLAEVRVAAADQREDVDIDDWYLPDALMATLNLAITEAPRPQGASFESYPADTSPLPATRPPNFNGSDAAVRRARGFIERATVRGPNFAGRAAVARWGCGRNCERWAVVDMATGRISWVEDQAVQPVRRNFPCDAEAIEFRDDSRLLRVHRLEGNRVVTQDFLWWDDRLERAAESAQSFEQFCRR
jgi:hypothetical protein